MKPKTLYVCRPVLNAAEIDAWAKKAGIKKRLPLADLHVTVAYSTRPLVWPSPYTNTIDISPPRGETREVKPLGDEGAVVLSFDSSELYRRWRAFLDAGASWSYATYQPHVSLTYDGAGLDLAGIKPFAGAIELGPEKFAELDEGDAAKAKEQAA